MDEETAQTIGGLREEIRDMGTSLRAEISDVRAEISDVRAEIRDVRVELRDVRVELSDVRVEIRDVRAEIRDVKTSLGGEIQRVEETLRTEMRQMEAGLGARIDEARRHTDVLVASVRDDVRIVAEGVVSIQRQITELSRKS